ncbi:UNVERIFIED_CONTAM: hypothetical protein PYX00_004645 [Menopon gallinae]|uniref:Gustatory receptor n=1 Tax=Menopon gallinae TaxID=328185 RepID=A0AAW2I569_9NEOP
MADLARDNFERAGLVWEKVTTVVGLACLTREGDKITVSRWKVAYCAVILSISLIFTFLRILVEPIDRKRSVAYFVYFITVCNSLCCSAAIIGLTIYNRERDAANLQEMRRLRRRYNLRGCRSMWSYFPPSFIIPCLTIVGENIYFAVVSPIPISPLTFTSYFFSIYNFILYGNIHFHLSMVKDGFSRLNGNLKELETKASTGNRERVLLELRGLRSMHHEFFECFSRSERLLSSRIILSIGYNFVNCVLFTFYGFIDGLRVTWRFSPLTEWVTAFYWAVCCFFGLYVMILPFERIREQAHLSVIAIQSLSTRSGYSSSFYNELLLFSSQIILDDVEFGPNDFLNMNKRMLLSAFGAVTSSLTILLQMWQG